MGASIIGCIVSISYTVSVIELDHDKSVQNRNNFGNFHGYIPNSSLGEAAVILGLVLFISGVLAAKLVALAIIVGASTALAAAWCSIEAASLFALRYFAEERRWKFYIRGISGALPTLVIHLCIYMAAVAAPGPMIR